MHTFKVGISDVCMYMYVYIYIYIKEQIADGRNCLNDYFLKTSYLSSRFYKKEQ